MKVKSILILLLITIFSCKEDERKVVVEEHFCEKKLEISIDEIKITITDKNNFATVEIQKLVNSETVIDIETFKVSTSEKQKLFANAYKLITLKNYTIKTKTCTAGQEFSLKLTCNDNKVVEFQRHSVANWSKISKETEALFAVLKSKLKVKE